MIFLDSGFLIAVFSQKDQWHNNALKLLDYVDNQDNLVISNLILSETITGINKKVGVEEAKKAYDYLIDNCIIITETKKLYPKAMKTLIKYNNLSFADSLSIEIMELMNIYEIVSFDDDFDNKDGIVRIH